MLKRCVVLFLLLLTAWCVMTITHECGHLIGGWSGGGTLKHVELRPWHLPHSLFDPDPQPLLTLWSGPILGVMVPIIAALLVRRQWMWFIADFCLLANGCYLAAAWITGDRWLDTARLLEAGAGRVSILGYCILTILPGYLRFRTRCIELLWPGTPSDCFPIEPPVD